MRCCCIENRDRLILNKIIGYCDRVRDNLNRYQSSYEAFLQDYLFQDACCMCVVQIGELVAQLSEQAAKLCCSVAHDKRHTEFLRSLLRCH